MEERVYRHEVPAAKSPSITASAGVLRLRFGISDDVRRLSCFPHALFTAASA
jgi:hypothetical protein